MREAPTPAQRRILTTFVDLEAATGWPPTQTEIAHKLGIERSSVCQQVNELVRKGWLERTRARASANLRLVTYPPAKP